MTPQEQRDLHIEAMKRELEGSDEKPSWTSTPRSQGRLAVLGEAGKVPFFDPLASMSDKQLRAAMRRPVLPMPGVEAGSDLEKLVKPAWDIVSRLWPTMAAKVPRIRFMTETESGRHSYAKTASAALHTGTGELVMPQNSLELRPEVLWHELVHLEQRERGVLQSQAMRDETVGLTPHGQLMESEAHQRGNMQAEDLIARAFDPKITAPDFSLHRGTEPQGTMSRGGKDAENLTTPTSEASQSSSGSGGIPTAKAIPADYDKRDKEVGKYVAGMSKERLRREKQTADLKASFARGAGGIIGTMLGRQANRILSKIPGSLRSPLMEAMGGVPMFGEGMDASVSSGGGSGGGGNGDLHAKLDKIIDMLSQLGRSGSNVVGPQPETAFASGEAPQQNMARQVGRMALEAATTASGGGSSGSSDSMWEMAAKAMMRALVAAAV